MKNGVRSHLPQLAYVWNYLRFTSARLRHGTSRFYTGNLARFYEDLEDAGVPYVVLRWADRVPSGDDLETAYKDDIDHLISDDALASVLKVSAQHSGSVKCDYYSVTGRSGSAYQGMPYYMPTLAQRILASKQKDEAGFFRPAPHEEFCAFAYHLCYHKGLLSGLQSGLPGLPDAPVSKKRHGIELARLAGVADIRDVDENVTLLSLHQHLEKLGWSMPLDLMMRWPDRHPFMVGLQEKERQNIAPFATSLQGYTAFVLREDCNELGLEEIARRMILERFEILQEVRLSEVQKDRLMSRTRGGNWIEKYCNAEVEPTVVLICKDAPEPGPLPTKMSRKKVAKRYPHVENTDVLIKRSIRDAINKAAPLDHTRVAIHATDNKDEMAETLLAIFGEDTANKIADLKRKL